MKLIIDISENDYDLIKDYGINTFPTVGKAIANGTPIPDNATNGEVIKALFGKVSEFMGYTRIITRIDNWFNKGVVAEFDKDWWNAPYQKGGK